MKKYICHSRRGDLSALMRSSNSVWSVCPCSLTKGEFIMMTMTMTMTMTMALTMIMTMTIPRLWHGVTGETSCVALLPLKSPHSHLANINFYLFSSSIFTFVSFLLFFFCHLWLFFERSKCNSRANICI